jgi:response regulator NasT
MPAQNLSIAIVDDNRLRASIIEDGLREAGHLRVTVITEMNGVGQALARLSPDVVVIDLENPNRDMLEHFFSLSRALKKPIAMFVDRSDDRSIEAAIEAGVSAYVVDGLKKERIKPILDTAILRFNAFSRLTEELAEARSALEDRKIIDKAKGIVMRSKGVSEPEAYDLLRKTAMNQNRRIVDVAQSLILASGLLE